MFGPNFISSVKNTLWSENIWAISLASILSTLPGVSSKTPNWRGQITQAKRTFQLTHSLDRVIVAPNVKACRHLVHLPAADVVRNNVARGSFLDIHAFVPVRGDNVPVHEVVVTVIRFVQIFELNRKSKGDIRVCDWELTVNRTTVLLCEVEIHWNVMGRKIHRITILGVCIPMCIISIEWTDWALTINAFTQKTRWLPIRSMICCTGEKIRQHYRSVGR